MELVVGVEEEEEDGEGGVGMKGWKDGGMGF